MRLRFVLGDFSSTLDRTLRRRQKVKIHFLPIYLGLSSKKGRALLALFC
jgi:hypothetical protein